MKEIFNRQITSRPISGDDCQAYQDFSLRIHGKDDSQRMLGGKDPELYSNWRNLLEDGEYQRFGLFQENKLIGSSAIAFRDGEAVFTGIIIDPEYRGQGLATQLHDVRKRHINQTGFEGRVVTEILHDNIASIKAAERNGFTPVSTKVSDGVTYLKLALT